MSIKKENKSVGVYVPLLVVLLLVAVFFVGRLSSQVEMMGDGSVVKEKLVDSGAVADQGAGVAVAADVSDLKVMAGDLGLNQKDFDSCLDDGRYEQRIKDEVAYGGEIGVSGTPSFFINKVMVVGSQPVTVFEDVIDYELGGGNWDNPTEAMKYLVDENPSNGEVSIVANDVLKGIGAIRGNDGALVKIVEFSDFECPYCTSSQPTVEGLFEKYGDKISLEYRHYPLSFHANAQKMAEASECAREQGKFWEMHNTIFGI